MGCLSLKVFEFLAEVGAGAVDPCFDRAYTGVERLGDLVVAEALLLEHEDGVALIVGEGGEGAVEGFFDFAGVVGRLWLALHEIFAGIDEFERAAGFLAVAVDQPAAGECEDKCAESALRLIAGGRPVEFDKGLLREIFGVGAVAGGAVEEVDQARLPAVDDLCEGSLVAFGQGAEAGAVDIFDRLNGGCGGGAHIPWSGRELFNPSGRCVTCKSGCHV